ncbi:RluA family pseudouridine synthase [Mycoplasmopsis arginini]|uniref:Pseudouridine synthase n=1 Tax=Mycoplasmopsis arginini TaxID=2094 RepID=A0AA43TZH8_MYCAR|nr:RluA family pseudouridine synthase [Mycoplasmopsis arginini]MCY2903110.1 RluA family pseudouridine synthase [Mycoplasmopsis arginini QMP CG1-2758]MDI3349390.1 RluA family pseudouridine synthase [Mycoplasmopsis arginini]MDI3350216.1 RluA family pseudouridine synthase [Mycoplasmopsis arginini]MDI3350747.1 RluA family pseudouridine synthase [Mycoplasmopsis arginini]MDI3352348.1 RluA family pseudouridine synthase [Mycoplasmopsis arginini]
MLKLIVNYSERIDKYITNNSSITRNDIQELIKEGAVFVNGTKINKNKFVVKENDVIKVIKVIDKQINVEEQKIELDIIYENEDYLVINKPSGLVVHPAPGHRDNTLVNGLMYHFKNNLSNVNGLLRMGVVHRIDKDTSGLLIIAKNNPTHNYFASLLKEHKIDRTYLAIVDGKIANKKMHIDLPIGRDIKNRQKYAVTEQNSKNAYTMVEVIKYLKIDNKDKTLVKCNLKTGRTHQIRVHLNYIKHPVYGDPIYNKKVDEFNQRLHAVSLDFIDNKGSKVHFEAPIPEIMLREIEQFK